MSSWYSDNLELINYEYGRRHLKPGVEIYGVFKGVVQGYNSPQFGYAPDRFFFSDRMTGQLSWLPSTIKLDQARRDWGLIVGDSIRLWPRTSKGRWPKAGLVIGFTVATLAGERVYVPDRG